MQSFEFLMVTVSIVVGLGITELLGVVARILRRELEPGWLHSLWMTAALLHLLQTLWAAWAYQGRADWTFTGLVVFLTPRLLLFLMAAMLCPPVGEKAPLDDYFMDIRRRFLAAFIAFQIAASLAFFVLAEGPGLPDIVRGVMVVLLTALSLSERRAAQLFGVGIVLLIFSVFTFSFSFSLLDMFGSG